MCVMLGFWLCRFLEKGNTLHWWAVFNSSRAFNWNIPENASKHNRPIKTFAKQLEYLALCMVVRGSCYIRYLIFCHTFTVNPVQLSLFDCRWYCCHTYCIVTGFKSLLSLISEESNNASRTPVCHRRSFLVSKRYYLQQLLVFSFVGFFTSCINWLAVVSRIEEFLFIH